MLGNTESGKTTYMSSAYGLLQTPVYGFTVRAIDNSTHSWLTHLYNDLLTHNVYPIPTDKRSTYAFNLFYQGKSIIKFEWKDVRGGIIDETSSEAKEFIKDINKSDALMMFFEGNSLLKNISTRTRLRRICNLIINNLDDIDDDYYITILITKYDLISNADFSEVIEPLADFIEMAEENGNIHVFVVPVACTKDELLHVDLPLLTILFGGVMNKYVSKKDELEDIISEAESLQSNAWFGNDIYSLITGEKSYREKAEDERQKAVKKYKLVKKIEKATLELEGFIDEYEFFKCKSKFYVNDDDDLFSL